MNKNEEEIKVLEMWECHFTENYSVRRVPGGIIITETRTTLNMRKEYSGSTSSSTFVPLQFYFDDESEAHNVYLKKLDVIGEGIEKLKKEISDSDKPE